MFQLVTKLAFYFPPPVYKSELFNLTKNMEQVTNLYVCMYSMCKVVINIFSMKVYTGLFVYAACICVYIFLKLGFHAHQSIPHE